MGPESRLKLDVELAEHRATDLLFVGERVDDTHKPSRKVWVERAEHSRDDREALVRANGVLVFLIFACGDPWALSLRRGHVVDDKILI
jgi:hypothetical protein